MNDSSAKEIDNFLKIFHLKQSMIFGDAEYQANTNKQKLWQKPAEMPDDEDLAKFNEHVTSEETRLTDPYYLCDKKDYVTLRDVTVSRLTIFNVRRGGEPSRLMISEWHDTENGAWLGNTFVSTMPDHTDRSRLAKDNIAYQGGKGNNHLVSIVIPLDTVVAMKVLGDEVVRESAGILPCNRYMFPYSQMCQDHVIGSHGISRITYVTKRIMSH